MKGPAGTNTIGMPISSTMRAGAGMMVRVELGAGVGVVEGTLVLVLVRVAGIAVAVAAGVGEALGDGERLPGGSVGDGETVGAVVHPVASRINTHSHPDRASFKGLNGIAQYYSTIFSNSWMAFVGLYVGLRKYAPGPGKNFGSLE